MIHRYYKEGQKLNVADLNEIIVLIDRTETELTEVALNTWRPGLIGPPHRHDQKEQIFYVTSGTGTVKVGAEIFQVNPGDLIYIPLGVEHQTIASKNEALHYILFNVFIDPEKEGHGTFAEHIEKVKNIRKRQAETGRATVENAERSAFSNKQPKYIRDLNKGDSGPSNSVTSRIVLDRSESERSEMVVVSWPKGNKGALEMHPEKEQTFFVLAGSGIIKISEEQALVKPGDIIFVPRNAYHCAEAKSEDLRYLCLNTYARW
ncbi:MAG: cupin domain-containing protein [candidate division KSB1 bacterium]|nr:cupin domain-containing protein [candidate division KSB1 bacterium]MDZ7335845.1 cupin domain-containing protein [candidate division KSB1 bacterium]MDZ7358565.1 cupin domain-containing protein [candidate division KSB1 bacterium]MDZ7376674.1 cupin domain-containing protein [candidate division KSB1 bacterium]MDZ7400165.1 cupin domain-containing protein [candidate division KSB1 bacterium]